MITLWMLYSLAIAGWIYVAATALERGTRTLGLPTRWIWSAAPLLAVVLPLARLFGIGGATPIGAAPMSPGAAVEVPFGVITATPGLIDPIRLTFLDRPLTVLWVGATVLLSGWLLALAGRLARDSRSWPVRRIGGVDVRVSPDTGPAVIGVLPGTVVLPTWIDQLPEPDQTAVLRHELEHLRGHDNALIVGALSAVVMMPWNFALWAMFRRLRHAVEFDCDRRVIAGGVPRRRYGLLLLEVTRRRTASRALLTALSHDASLLSRRIEMLKPITRRFSALRVGAAVAVAGLVVAAACETPSPPALADLSADADATLSSEPRRLSSPAPRYPTMLRQAGIEGEVVLDFVVNPDGTVDEGSITIVSSTNRAFEGPARQAVAQSTFAPAIADGEPVAASAQQRISFNLQDAEAGSDAASNEGGPLVYIDEILVGRKSSVRKVDSEEAFQAIAELDPVDIARIEVLKGRIATAQFGDSAAGGVIRVTTKRGGN